MAGAQALGEFVSLTAEESFAIEYWPLELYKLAQAPPPGELQGKVALVTGGAGGIGRAIVETLAARGRRAWWPSTWTRTAPRTPSRPMVTRGLAVSGDVTSEDAVAAAYAAAVERFGGVDIVVSNAGIASSSPIEDTSLAEWERNHRILVTGYFLVAREAFRVLRAQDTGGSIVFVASKNALVAGKNATAYSSAKAAELHLARCLAEEGGEAGIRANTVNPDAVLSGSRIWGPDSLARGARRGLRHRAPRARGALPPAQHAQGQHHPAGHRRGGPALRLRGALGQEHRQPAQRRRRRPRRLRALSGTHARHPHGRERLRARAGRPVHHLFQRHAVPGGGAGHRGGAGAARLRGRVPRRADLLRADARQLGLPATRRGRSPSGSGACSPAPTPSCARARRAPGFVREQYPRLGVPFEGPPVYELCEFLVDVLGVEDVGASFPHRVTLHPTCHSVRALHIGDRPERLLRAVRGIDLVEMDEALECCGFGGTFAVKNADTSMAMLSRQAAPRARHARGGLHGGRTRRA